MDNRLACHNPHDLADCLRWASNCSKNPHDYEDISMQLRLDRPSQLGPVLRAVRKAQRLRQDDAAGAIGVSENFLSKLERGGGSVRWDKLFQVLDGLGVHVILDLPEELAPKLQSLAEATDKSPR